MRAPDRLSIWLNDTDLRDTALNNFTGMLTSPKLIDPLQMALGMRESLFRYIRRHHGSPRSAGGNRRILPEKTAQTLGRDQTTPRSEAHRVSSWRVDSWSLR